MPQDGSDGRSRFAGSLRRRLLLAALAVIAPLLLGAGLWMILLSRSADSYEQLAREATRESDESVLLLQHLSQAQEAGSSYMEGGDADDRRAFAQAALKVNRGLAGEDSYDEPAEQAGLAAITRPWKRASHELATYSPASDGTRTDATADPEDRFEANVDAATTNLERLMAGSQAEILADLVAAERSTRLNWVLGLVAVVMALLVAAVLANRLSKGLAKPLHELARGARSLAAGHLGHRVAISSTTELDEVGGTFNAMAEALQRQRQELEQHAFADSLTGLANRALFEDRVRHALGRSAGRDGRVAVLVLDLDGFKLVNDGLGHACGDELLRDAGERMAGVLRPSDTIARLGSDEFAVLLENVRGLDDALGPAERLRRVFREPFAVKDSEVMLTASIGIALSAGSTRDEADLLRRADLAMYRVKQRGRNACEFFDPAMDDQATERLETVNALRRAIDRDQLVVHYQPILDLDTGEIRAAEALLRWNRPGHGLVPPLAFIPLAEQTGEIVALGAWVLNEACEEACRWISSGNASVPVTVNVSARQLVDPGFEGIVANALATSGLDSSGLILEVTESSVMQHAEVAVAKLRRISETGVRIALDDFGEGYSSLGQLRELPIDIVKIARPFVRELTENDRDPALVRGIIELARSLGLRLVAEGIEYPEQQAILRAFDCELGQGFLFARPLEAPGLHALLGERPAALHGRAVG